MEQLKVTVVHELHSLVKLAVFVKMSFGFYELKIFQLFNMIATAEAFKCGVTLKLNLFKRARKSC